MCEKIIFLLLPFTFFVFDFREFYYNMSWRGLFRVESLELPISFINLDVQICPQIGKFSGIISSNKLFAPFSFYLLFLSINTYMAYFIDFHNSCKLYSLFLFYFITFFLLWLYDFKWPAFLSTNSFFCFFKTVIEALYWSLHFSHCIP